MKWVALLSTRLMTRLFLQGAALPESPCHRILHLIGMLCLTCSGSTPCLHISISRGDFKTYPHLLLTPKLIKSESQQGEASAVVYFKSSPRSFTGQPGLRTIGLKKNHQAALKRHCKFLSSQCEKSCIAKNYLKVM